MTEAVVKPDALITALDKLKPQLRDALPRSMSADHFARVVLTEVRKTPQLLTCVPQSFFAAVFTSAQLGLEIGSHLGEAFVLPFRNNKKGVTEATLVIGYKGLVKLLWSSEMVSSLSEVVVHEKDNIEYRRGDDEAIIHEPYTPPRELLAKCADQKSKLSKEEIEALDPGPAIAYYAIIETKGGGKRRSFMWVSEVLKHRDRYVRNLRDDSVWVSNFDAMALKTVIVKAARLAPRAIERPSLQQAIALDELAEHGVSQELALPVGVGEDKVGLSVSSFTSAETISAEDDRAPGKS